MSRDHVIKKVRKLLALAEGKANEHESANALAQAQRLMDEYKIEQALIEEPETETTIEEELRVWEDPIDRMGGSKAVRWKGALASSIAKANGCYIYWGQRLAKEYKGNGRTWLNNYKLGAVDTIRDKLRRMRETLPTDYARQRGVAIVRVQSALAKIDERVELAHKLGKKQLNLRSMGSSSSRYNHSAREQGREDGSSINLSSGPGLGAGARKQLGNGN